MRSAKCTGRTRRARSRRYNRKFPSFVILSEAKDLLSVACQKSAPTDFVPTRQLTLLIFLALRAKSRSFARKRPQDDKPRRSCHVWPKLYSALPCSSAPPPPLKCRTTFPFVILSEAKDLLSLAPLKLLTRMTKECALHHRPQGVHPATLPVSMPRDHRYFVYILSSKSRRIYTGVTNNLFRRILQHK